MGLKRFIFPLGLMNRIQKVFLQIVKKSKKHLTSWKTHLTFGFQTILICLLIRFGKKEKADFLSDGDRSWLLAKTAEKIFYH